MLKGLGQKAHPPPMEIYDDLLAVSGAPDGRSIAERPHGLDNGCILVAHGRSGLCLGGTARRKLAYRCDDARYCKR